MDTRNKRNCVLLDIDHTIANSFWRDPMIGGPGGWDAYHAASVDDQPIHDMKLFAEALYVTGYTVIGFTARPEKWRKLTLDWLVKHRIFLDELLMRPDAAFHPAPEIKMQLALNRFEGLHNLQEQLAFIVDDREDVCAAFKAIGITTLQVSGRQR